MARVILCLVAILLFAVSGLSQSGRTQPQYQSATAYYQSSEGDSQSGVVYFKVDGQVKRLTWNGRTIWRNTDSPDAYKVGAEWRIVYDPTAKEPYPQLLNGTFTRYAAPKSNQAQPNPLFALERVENPSSRSKEVSRSGLYKLRVPDNWSEHPWGNYPAFTPEGAYFSEGGRANMTHGINFGVVPRQNDLAETTRRLFNKDSEANPHLQQRGGYQSALIAGREALVVTSSGHYEFTGLIEIVILYTALLPNGDVFHLSTVMPEDDYAKYQPVFEEILNSIRFITNSRVTPINKRAWQIILDARENWFDTGIAVTSGMTVSISASGNIVWNPKQGYATATPAGVYFSPSELDDSSGFPSVNAKCGSLLMRIGPEVYAVGSGANFKLANIEATQTLQFMVNDRYSWLYDNSGTFAVRVTAVPSETDRAKEPQNVTVTGYLDVVEMSGSNCQLRIVAGEKLYSGEISFRRLSELTAQRIGSYEDAVAILNGKQINATLSGLTSPANATSGLAFGNITQMTFAAGQEAKPTTPRWGERTTATEVIIDLPADILFDFNKSNIKPEAIPTLITLARLIRQANSQKIQLNGYTDSIASEAYNLGLSERRAAAVKQWLVNQGGAEANRLTTKGYGESQPVAPNTNPDGSDNPSGRQKNRRVEVRIPRT